MENSSNNFAEDMAYATLLETQESDFNTQFADSPGPDDEDEVEEEQDEEESGEDGEEKGRGKGGRKGGEESNNGDDPPLDEDVVHSPVTTQTGGRAKT